jgi:cysteine synthase A
VNTRLVKIKKSNTGHGEIIAKLEMFNPLSSVKDRIAIAMIEAAEKSGKVNKKTTFIEPTSGNTGIGLAFVCASKGYKLVLTMPDTMSVERRNLLKALGAELVLTDGTKGMKGAIDKALELKKTTKNSIILQQFENTANPDIHRKTTAKEIINDTDGKIDYFVAGIGTGGTITGVGEELKKHNPNIKVIAVEPENSPVLSGGNPGAHKIQGIGAGFVPRILNTNIFDKVIKVSNEKAAKYTKTLARNEGIFVGISSGAAFCAALEISKTNEAKNKKIVVIFPDTGERYLSTDIFIN